MTPRLASLARALGQTASLDELRDAGAELVRPLGFRALTLGVAPLVRGAIISGRAVLLSTLPAEFQREYHARDMASFDPVFELMARRYLPYTKSSIEDLFQPAPAHRAITDLADQHDLGEALMVPMNTADFSRGVALFTPESPTRFGDRLAREEAELLHAARLLMSRAEALGFAPLAPTDPESVALTPREAECLSWCAMGRTNDEIAGALDISERTVRYHLGNAFAKLGTDRRTLAVTRAVQLGLIRT